MDQSKPTLVCMVGLPRSGKSTIVKELSKELGAPIVRRDDIRLALHGQRYQALAEPFVKAISIVMIRSLFLSGHKHVICDETNYSRAARDFNRNDKVWNTQFYWVRTSAQICKERAVATGQPDLIPVIDEMQKRWEPFTPKDEMWWPTDPPKGVDAAENCAKCGIYEDLTDKLIYHQNNHVWPGFSGEPTGVDFGGSDF